MSTVNQESLGFGRYYRQFSSNYAFTKETLLALAIPMVSANLILDFGRIPGEFWKWLLVASVGYLCMLAVAAIVGYIYRRVNVPMYLYMPTFFLIGIVRGFAIYLTGLELDIISEQGFFYRILGSATYVFVMMSVFATLHSNFERAGKSIRELEVKRLSLENRLNSMKIEISEQNSAIAGRVSGLLSPVIADLIIRLKAAKGSEIGKQVAALRDTVENVVRPMSHSVVNTSASLSEPNFSLSRSGMLRRLNLDAKIPLKDIFLPTMSAFLLILISFPSALSIAGAPNGVILVLLLGLTALVLLRGARAAARNLLVGTFLAVMINELVYLTIGVVTLGAIYLIDHSLLDAFVSRVLVLVLVFGLTLFLGQARYLHLNRANQELVSVNSELEKLNAQAKQELWVTRRRIATVLHGPVQAALYSSAIRLAQSKRPGKKLIQEVNDDLTEALRALNFEQSPSFAVKTVLQEIVEVWVGVADIYISIPKTVYDVTKKNLNTAEALIEIIREATSNAIKHGGATEIEITAKYNSGVISVQVINNGKLPSERQASTGYGTRILNELALAWKLTANSSGKALFSAEIVAKI